MRTKSPQRTRRIRNACLVGALVGFALALVAYSMSHKVLFFPLMIAIGTVMAGAVTAMSQTDYDFD